MESKLSNFHFDNINIYDIYENVLSRVINRIDISAQETMYMYNNMYLENANKLPNNFDHSSIYYLISNSEFAYYLRCLSFSNDDFLFIDTKYGLIEENYEVFSLWDYIDYREAKEFFYKITDSQVIEFISDYIDYYSYSYNKDIHKYNSQYNRYIDNYLINTNSDIIFKDNRVKIDIDFSDSYVWQIVIERNEKKYDFSHNILSYRVNILSIDLLRNMIYSFLLLNLENIDITVFLFFIQDSKFAIEFLNENYILSDKEVLNSRDLSEFFTMFNRDNYNDDRLLNKPLSMHDCDEIAVLMYYYYYLACINQESTAGLMSILITLDSILMNKYAKNNDPVTIDLYKSIVSDLLCDSIREFRYAAGMSVPDDIHEVINSDHDRYQYYYQSLQKSREFMMKIIGILNDNTAFYKIFDTVLSNTDLEQLRAYFSYNFNLLTYRKEEKNINKSFFKYLLEERRSEADIPIWKKYFYLRYLSEKTDKWNLSKIVTSKNRDLGLVIKRINSKLGSALKPYPQRYYINVYVGAEKLNINKNWNTLVNKYGIDCRDFCKLLRYKNLAMASEDPYYNLLFFRYDYLKSAYIKRNIKNNRNISKMKQIELTENEEKIKLIKIIGKQKNIVSFIRYSYVIVNKLNSAMGEKWILSFDRLSSWREVLAETYKDDLSIQMEKNNLNSIKKKLELNFLKYFKNLFDEYGEAFVLSLDLKTIIELIKIRNGVIDCDANMDVESVTNELNNKVSLKERISEIITLSNNILN